MEVLLWILSASYDEYLSMHILNDELQVWNCSPQIFNLLLTAFVSCSFNHHATVLPLHDNNRGNHGNSGHANGI